MILLRKSYKIYKHVYFVIKVQIFGNILKIKNSIQEEIKSRLKSGNSCYHSVQTVLSYSLLSKNMEIKINRNINLPFFCVGVELGR